MVNQIEGKELEEVVDDYFLGELSEIKSLNEGFINKSFYINTSKGEYVIRASHPGKTKEDTVFETDILKQLKETPAADFVIENIETPDGMPFLLKDDQLYTLFKFIEGENFYGNWNRHDPDKSFIESLGERCAILHNSLSYIDIPPLNKEPLSQRLEKYISDLESLGLKMKSCRPLVTLLEKPSLVHTDLRIRNFVVNASEIDTILDFDDLTYGNQEYDIAWTIKQCFSLLQNGSQVTPIINTEATRLFIKSYLKNIENEVNIEDVVRLIVLSCVRAIHFLQFSASPSITKERIHQLTSVGVSQLDFFSDSRVVDKTIKEITSG